jgi:hypothetical protein
LFYIIKQFYKRFFSPQTQANDNITSYKSKYADEIGLFGLLLTAGLWGGEPGDASRRRQLELRVLGVPKNMLQYKKTQSDKGGV